MPTMEVISETLETETTDQTPEQVTEEATAYTKAEQIHYQEIREKESQVGKLSFAAEAAKERAKAAKSRYDAAATELHELIRRGPDDQQKLPGMEDANKPGPEAWRALPLSVAGIEGAIAKALAAEEFETLGQVADYLAAGSTITDIKGIGPEKGEKYEELMIAFWADHPEFCGGGDECSPPEDEDYPLD